MPDAYVRSDDGGLRVTALIAYGLFVAAIFNGFTAIAGVILAYIKRDEARGTMWEGHFRNLIHVFWISLVLGVIAMALVAQGVLGFLFAMLQSNGNPAPALVGSLVFIVPAFLVAAAIFTIWYFYRTLRGLIRALDGKPY